MIKMGSFRSWVGGLEEYEMRVPHPVTTAFLQPKFLSGELVVAEAHNVLKFTSLSKKKGLSGSLFVTNARLVFVSSDQVCTEDSIPLLSIHSLCQYEEPKGSSGKRSKRRVKLGSQIQGSPTAASASLFCPGSTRIHELLVICSNFRTLRVSFKFSLVDHGQKICNALIHWSFPKPPEKLFYLDYCRALESKYNYSNSLPLYNLPGDWLREIKICRVTGYRITMANINFEICESLPETIVVPANFNDVRLGSLASKLKGNRPPFWVWGDVKGSAILRMGKLHNEADGLAENAFYETLRGSHPQKRRPYISDLDLIFPVKEIRQSMMRLIELCCPETFSNYEDMDSKFLSLLESTKWLSWSSKVLQLCSELAQRIVRKNDVVILQENVSRDTSCLISSITQTILDARFRTVTGFFSLIQKDWVAAGHAFHSDYMHTSPIFLLFLDSVYQLLVQNPFDFEFNEHLLNDVWDSCFDSTTGTFLFDSPGQRKTLEARKDLTIWHRILTKEEGSIDAEYGDDLRKPYPQGSAIPKSLLNPMYRLKPLLYPPAADGFTNNYAPLIRSFSAMSEIQLWSSLYLSRTAEPEPIITSNNGSHKLSVSSPVPYVKNMEHSPRPQTPNSSGSLETTFSSSSPNQGSVFLFSTNTSNADAEKVSNNVSTAGRDPLIEAQLVDLLLTTLSASTRYQRNSTGVGKGPTVPTTGSSGSAGLYGARNPFNPGTTSSPIHNHTTRRQNPFADSLG